MRKLGELESLTTNKVLWPGPLRAAVKTWNTDEDLRWRENLKFYYLHSSFWSQSPRSSEASKSDKKSMWLLPGMTSENIFLVSNHIEYLENQLHCCETHGIAFMLREFISTFTRSYTSEDCPAECLQRDIAEFSSLAEEALEAYYEPIDIVALFKKSKQYLGFVIRGIVLEDVTVRNLLLTAIKAERVEVEKKLSERYQHFTKCDLLDVNPIAKRLLVSVSRSDPGFGACVQILQTFSAIPRLKDQVQAVYDLSQRVNDAILYTIGAGEQIALDADDLLTLFAFFLMRAGAEDIGANVELLTSLVPTDVMADATSYSLATLESALEYIASRIPVPAS